MPPDAPGIPLRVHGTVVSTAGCAPLADALVDVWHADADGLYGLESPAHGPRARMHTGPGGAYAFETVVPGSYRDEGLMRAAHIHFKVAGDGHAPLTTQLFFAGDPYLYDDPHARPGLIRPLERRAGGPGAECRFDLVLFGLRGG